MNLVHRFLGDNERYETLSDFLTNWPLYFYPFPPRVPPLVANLIKAL